jgi:hypothetical protein
MGLPSSMTEEPQLEWLKESQYTSNAEKVLRGFKLCDLLHDRMGSTRIDLIYFGVVIPRDI